jgi:hypothetical protein
MSEIKSMNPESNSNEIYATVFNMFQALPKEELAYWEEKTVLVRANPSVSPHIICDVAFKKSATKKSSARKKKEPGYKLFAKEMCPKIISEKPDLTLLEVRKELGALWHALSNEQKDAYRK